MQTASPRSVLLVTTLMLLTVSCDRDRPGASRSRTVAPASAEPATTNPSLQSLPPATDAEPLESVATDETHEATPEAASDVLPTAPAVPRRLHEACIDTGRSDPETLLRWPDTDDYLADATCTLERQIVAAGRELSLVWGPWDQDTNLLLMVPTEAGIEATVVASQSQGAGGDETVTVERFDVVDGSNGEAPRVEIETRTLGEFYNCTDSDLLNIEERSLVICELREDGAVCTPSMPLGGHSIDRRFLRVDAQGEPQYELEERGFELDFTPTGNRYHFGVVDGSIPPSVEQLLGEHSFDELRSLDPLHRGW